MKNITIRIISFSIFVILFGGCKKWAEETTNIYSYTPPPAVAISDAAPLCGSIKGTMLTGKTYTIGCDVIINKGDTVILQPGVTINVTNQAGIVVRGVLISQGTQTQPNWITVAGVTKTDSPGVDPATDPAYKGLWKGIYCDTSCTLLSLKWTHVEFAGAALGATLAPSLGQKAATNFSILFQNPNGYFVMEDSWLYGGIDDPIRISNGKIAIFRNTFEKGGLNGGDCINCKGGTVGDMAYNFFIGIATNGQKASNKGQPAGAAQTNIVMYNNTFVDCGYRQIQTGRGANINYEEGARGKFYNNVAINCKFGYRVVNTPAADTANLFYGYNYQWADSVSVANQFYPTGYITKPQPTDIPNPATYLPANYTLGQNYDGTNAVQKFNPLFINFPLPLPAGLNLRDISAVANFNFRLQSGSPLIGKGYTGLNLAPLMTVPQDNTYGVTEYTLPGADLGCYQINGKGNQH